MRDMRLTRPGALTRVPAAVRKDVPAVITRDSPMRGLT